MADLCVCGHEEREHVRVTAFGVVVCSVADDPVSTDDGVMQRACACTGYRRSPLSAFRGPAVRFTREEAIEAAKLLGFGVTGLDTCSVAEMRRAARDRIEDARFYVDHYDATDAGIHYLAARILRAVRP